MRRSRRPRPLAVAALAGALAAAAAPAAAQEPRARAQLERSLGTQGVVDVDPRTGTPRMLARLDGTLTGPSDGRAVDLALRYVRRNLPALGLTEADLRTLGPARRTATAGGVEQLRWGQYQSGIPALDSELRVNVTADGRVLSVLGSPQHGLRVGDTEPAIGAREALRVAGGAAAVVSGPEGPRRATGFRGGDRAQLAILGERLVWRVTHRASPEAVYDVIVDADSGRELRRANLVKSAGVFDHYPEAPEGGAQREVDLTPYLYAGADRLWGPFAEVYPDVNDNGEADPGEDVDPRVEHPFQSFGGGRSWDPGVPESWRVNRAQNAVQAFWFANRFHDHLEAPPIGFEGFEDLGAFEHMVIETNDGAETGKRDNANIVTWPAGDGFKGGAYMQTYLWSNGRNAGDDAAIVYHEYAHGLTHRLITDADGWGALSSPQAGALGEGWSDYFAKDFIVSEALLQDDPDVPGEIHMGEYVGGLRAQALDCPVGVAAPRCDDGGFTFGDFGRLAAGPQVHADGEIWAQTLWDVRTALGFMAARRVIGDALRLTPPEPSYIDARNAILLAAGAAEDVPPAEREAQRAALWDVFAKRGMGYYAATIDAANVEPLADTSEPPAPEELVHTISGRITDADTGEPVAGATVSVGGGLAAKRDPGGADDPHDLVATTGGDGRYSIANAPAGPVPLLVKGADGVDFAVVQATAAEPANAQLRRNWAATRGGAEVVDGNVETCGARFAVDQSRATAWSVLPRQQRHLVLKLPQPVDVTSFGIDPAAGCGHAPGAAARTLRIETDADGRAPFTPAANVTFAAGDGGRLHAVTPAGGAQNVRYVRVTLLESQGDAVVSLAELAVHGRPQARPARAQLEVSAAGAPVAGDAVAFDASGMSDTGGPQPSYRWDFGDGVQAETTGPTVTHAYAAAGSYRPTVTVEDSREEASASVDLEVAARPEPRSTPTPAPAAPAAPGPAPAPAPTVTPPAPALVSLLPRLGLPRTGSRGRARALVRCDSACSGRARLTVTRKLARRLGLGRRRTVGSARVRLAAPGRKRVTIRLSRKVRTRMKRKRMRRLTTSLKLTVRDAEGQRRSARRTVRIRR